MNRKGFTLIELLGTIVILALVMAIAGFSVTNIIKSSKKENYELLIKNIKDSAELYYQECKFGNPIGVSCTSSSGGYTISLGDLVKYGYLSGNSKMKDENGLSNKAKLINPDDTNDISSCTINIKYNSGKIIVEAASRPTESCPKTYN